MRNNTNNFIDFTDGHEWSLKSDWVTKINKGRKKKK